ncbi:hypothetical protein Rhal01_02467 [Rubritalea halochordaticola]|uniref:Tetratricopeptide repeat protein n=1 Tax=Rubritalea halochordaticola TaxID=714537 RepID=A0ABP9V2X9_9BACT
MAKLSFDPNLSPLPEARELWNLGRRDESLALFRTAHKEQKNNISAILDAARALGSSYQIKDAERTLNKLRPHAKKIPVLNLMMGQVYREIRRPDKALEYFNKAIQVIPDSVDALVEAAQLLERSGRPEVALKRIHKALSIQPDSHLLQIFHARLLAQTSQQEEAIKLYESLLSLPNLTQGLRCRALHELARLLEPNNPAEAVQLIQEAHSRRIDSSSPLLGRGETSTQQALKLGNEVPKGFYKELRDQIPSSKQKKIIFQIGFARSGTTLLEKLLTQSGDIKDAEELDLFGLYIHPIATGTLKSYLRNDEESELAVQFLRQRYCSGMEEYLNASIDQHWILDKNPSNTVICSSLARIFPEAKFLVMLRDPRDTLLSTFFQYLPLNPESVSFIQWETLIQRYCDTMQAWIQLRDNLPADSWLECRYESLTANPAEELSRVYQWLGMPGTPDSQFSPSIQKFVSSPSYSEVAQPVHGKRIGRWRDPAYAKLFDAETQERLAPIMQQLQYEW